VTAPESGRTCDGDRLWTSGLLGSQSRLLPFAHASTSGQFHAGRPPTVQLGSGNSPRNRHTSTVSRFTPRRSAISGMPTGSQVMERTVANLLTTDQDCSDTQYMTQTVTTTKARLLLNGDTILVTNKWWNTENGPLIPATKATARKWVREATVVSVEKMAHVYWVETSEGGFNASPQQTFQVVTP
jgi:hypothetical protein